MMSAPTGTAQSSGSVSQPSGSATDAGDPCRPRGPVAVCGNGTSGSSCSSSDSSSANVLTKANARRNKLLGLWAAELLGKKGEAAATYAAEVVKADFEAPGDEDVFRKVRADFDRGGVTMTDHQIHRQMQELMETAIEQVRSEKK